MKAFKACGGRCGFFYSLRPWQGQPAARRSSNWEVFGGEPACVTGESHMRKARGRREKKLFLTPFSSP